MSTKILIVTGSTGGHYIPAVATAEKIKEISPSAEIIFAGELKTKNLQIWKDKNFRFVPIPVIKRPSTTGILFFPFKFVYVLFYSIAFIKRETIQLVVGMGSYATIGAVLAGIMLKKRTLLHEQNYIPGIATKFLNFFGAPVALTFPETKQYLLRKKTYITGLPVRKEFYSKGEINFNNSGAKENKTTVLVTGGSQGAGFINELVMKTIPMLDPLKYRIIHITGKNDFEKVTNFYKKTEIQSYVIDFSLKVYEFFRSSDIIISRCGAATIAEILAMEKPSILIPFRFAGGHQIFNAKYCEKKGVCVILEEKSANPSALLYLINIINENIESFKKKFTDIKISDTGGRFAKLCLKMTGFYG